MFRGNQPYRNSDCRKFNGNKLYFRNLEILAVLAELSELLTECIALIERSLAVNEKVNAMIRI